MIYHVAAHNADNAGDIVLLDAVSKLLAGIDPHVKRVIDYRPQPVFDAPVFVGGGGLFIRDTRPNGKSGWRWNISLDELNAIQQPIIVYAVGLNRFRGQADFNECFTDHLRLLVDKAAFFSVRERASIQRLKPYLGEMVKKVIWQPCPAAMLGRLYEKRYPAAYSIFAPAMDRLSLRGNIEGIVPVLKRIPDLKIALHIEADWEFLHYFDGDVVDLRGKPAKEIISFYSRARQVIGMRLHSILIPFGFGVPIIPLISHDKLADFLTDIGHPEWGVELSDAHQVGQHLGKDQIDLQARDRLWAITKQNIREIKARLSDG